MALISQYGRLDYVKNTSKTVTIPINYPGWIHAHTQIYFVGADDFRVECAVIQMVGATSGVQNLYAGAVWGENLLTLTTYYSAWHSGMAASTIVNYWS